MVEEFFCKGWGWLQVVFLLAKILFQWESDLLDNLLEILEPVTLSLLEDSWRWIPDLEGIFSISSAYNSLVKELRNVDVLEPEVALVFDQIWESPTPSKVIAFSWQYITLR
jgi:hypothetical protein